jgi:hypothetical protein
MAIAVGCRLRFARRAHGDEEDVLKCGAVVFGGWSGLMELLDRFKSKRYTIALVFVGKKNESIVVKPRL